MSTASHPYRGWKETGDMGGVISGLSRATLAKGCGLRCFIIYGVRVPFPRQTHQAEPVPPPAIWGIPVAGPGRSRWRALARRA